MREGAEIEIDLRERLRFAAGSLAADFGHQLTTDHAEALVFRSAEGLLATASVTDFVPILAERRARLAVRSGAVVTAVVHAADVPEEANVSQEANGPLPRPGPAPLLAVPETQMTRLRGQVEQARGRVADWRADLDQR